jgi:hypothetical protein
MTTEPEVFFLYPKYLHYLREQCWLNSSRLVRLASNFFDGKSYAGVLGIVMLFDERGEGCRQCTCYFPKQDLDAIMNDPGKAACMPVSMRDAHHKLCGIENNGQKMILLLASGKLPSHQEAMMSNSIAVEIETNDEVELRKMCFPAQRAQLQEGSDTLLDALRAGLMQAKAQQRK